MQLIIVIVFVCTLKECQKKLGDSIFSFQKATKIVIEMPKYQNTGLWKKKVPRKEEW